MGMLQADEQACHIVTYNYQHDTDASPPPPPPPDRVQGTPQALELAAYLEKHAEEANVLPYNGGISTVQHQWLPARLRQIEAAGQRCFVACHHPIGAVRNLPQCGHSATLRSAAIVSRLDPQPCCSVELHAEIGPPAQQHVQRTTCATDTA